MSANLLDDPPNEVRIGLHLFRWEEPDTGYISYCGNLEGPAMGQLSELSRRFTVGQPWVFLIVDMSKVGKISAAARQQSARGSKDLNLRGIAVVGASTPLRLLAGVVARAIDLVNRNIDNPTRFFETEAEARSWIAARRSLIAQRMSLRGTSP